VSRLLIRHDDIRRRRRVVLGAAEIAAALPAAVAVVGANGSGKTSLLMHVTRTLAGQRTPATVLLGNRMVSAIGYVGQTFPLPPWLRAPQAAPLFACSYDELCARMPALHLDELRGEPIGALSPGQRQALALAFALGAGREMLVLDEPFASLDMRRRIGAVELLHEWVGRSPERALLLSSQHAPDLLELCTHFVVLRDGKYVFNDSRDALMTCVVRGPGAERQLVEVMTR
jgi:ABC-type multidrug transport system ATPase subunit